LGRKREVTSRRGTGQSGPSNPAQPSSAFALHNTYVTPSFCRLLVDLGLASLFGAIRIGLRANLPPITRLPPPTDRPTPLPHSTTAFQPIDTPRASASTRRSAPSSPSWRRLPMSSPLPAPLAMIRTRWSLGMEPGTLPRIRFFCRISRDQTLKRRDITEWVTDSRH
jgi:hypothetical protein